MKKQIIAAALAGTTLISAPAFAHGRDKASDHARMDRGLKLGILKDVFNGHSSQFIVVGTVDSVGTNSFVIKEKATAHVDNITNALVTIKTDSKTKISTPLAVGQSVVATGTISGTDLLATNVRVLPKPVEPKSTKENVAMGKVTAKTDTSVTITNTLTNTNQTITTDADTKVKIDGEVKSVSDINVGDSGWIRFKTVGTTLVAKIIHLFR